MMKVVLITGSHMRHSYILNELFSAGKLAGVIMEKREAFIPTPPAGLKKIDRENFIKHFEKRDEAEKKFFGNNSTEEIAESVPNLRTDLANLNSQASVDFIKKLDADFIFSYGCHLLSDEILARYDGRCFNLHGGLSPWFKGVATHFWPFYLLMPNWVGMTVHRTAKKADAGDILHQSVPILEKGDGMHDVACKAVFQSGKELVKILNLIENGKKVVCVPQKTSGKLFQNRDWAPQHLRLIYNTFNDDIVDCFLNGDISAPNPDIVDFLVSG